MLLVTLRPVLAVGDCLPTAATPQMRRHPLAFVEDLDRGGHRSDLDHFLHQVVRHAVVVARRRRRDSRC